jgi:hypothetical protein
VNLCTSPEIIVITLEKLLLVAELLTCDTVSIRVAVEFEDFTDREFSLLELLGNRGHWWVSCLTGVSINCPLAQDSEFDLSSFGLLGLLVTFALFLTRCICRFGIVILIFLIVIHNNRGLF